MIAAVASFLSISAGLNHSPAYQFFLYTHVNLSRDNRFVVTFNIILRNDASVLDPLFREEVHCISFLKQGIARIFLVCEDVINCAPMPSVSTSRSRSFLLSENSGNAVNGHTV